MKYRNLNISILQENPDKEHAKLIEQSSTELENLVIIAWENFTLIQNIDEESINILIDKQANISLLVDDVQNNIQEKIDEAKVCIISLIFLVFLQDSRFYY